MQAQTWDHRFDFQHKASVKNWVFWAIYLQFMKNVEEGEKRCDNYAKNKKEGKIGGGIKKTQEEMVKNDEWLSGFWYYYIKIQQWTQM